MLHLLLSTIDLILTRPKLVVQICDLPYRGLQFTDCSESMGAVNRPKTCPLCAETIKAAANACPSLT